MYIVSNVPKSIQTLLDNMNLYLKDLKVLLNFILDIAW